MKHHYSFPLKYIIYKAISFIYSRKKYFLLSSITAFLFFVSIILYTTVFSVKEKNTDYRLELPAGTYRIGGTGITPAKGCSFVSLSSAAEALKNCEITGPVVLLITNEYNSVEEYGFPIIFNKINGSNATNTITLRPEQNVNTSIVGISSSSIIKFNNSEYFIIDGSNNGTNSHNLNIINNCSDIQTAALWIENTEGLTKTGNITIKNTNIHCGNSRSTENSCYGIFIGHSFIKDTNSKSDNNIIIKNNIFSDCKWKSGCSGNMEEMLIDNNIYATKILCGVELAKK